MSRDMTYEQIIDELEVVSGYVSSAQQSISSVELEQALADLEIVKQMIQGIRHMANVQANKANCRVCRGTKELIIEGYLYECYYCKD